MTFRDRLETLAPQTPIAVGQKSSFLFIGYRKDVEGRLDPEDKEIYGAKIRDEFVRKWPGEPAITCLVCEGKKSGSFATWHEAMGEDPPKPKINNDGGVWLLREAIMSRAVEDYADCAPYWGTSNAKKIEKFLRSDWAELLLGASGDRAVEVGRLKGLYTLWRKKQKCDKCKNVECEHKSSMHFTAIEHGTPVCPWAAKKELEERRKKMEINEREMEEQITHLFSRAQLTSNDIYYTVIDGEIRFVVYPQIEAEKEAEEK